jgi:hypothetical protein
MPLGQPSIGYRFEYRVAVPCTGTPNGIAWESLRVPRTIWAREEMRVVARRTQAERRAGRFATPHLPSPVAGDPLPNPRSMPLRGVSQGTRTARSRSVLKQLQALRDSSRRRADLRAGRRVHGRNSGAANREPDAKRTVRREEEPVGVRRSADGVWIDGVPVLVCGFDVQLYGHWRRGGISSLADRGAWRHTLAGRDVDF